MGGDSLREVLSEFRHVGVAGRRPTASSPAAAILVAMLVMLVGASVVGLLARREPEAVAASAVQSASLPPPPLDQPEKTAPAAPAIRQVPHAPVAETPRPAKVGQGTLAATDKGSGAEPMPRLAPRREADGESVDATGEPRLKPGPAGPTPVVAADAPGSELLVLGQTLLAMDERRPSFYFDDEFAGPVALPAPPAVSLARDIDEEPGVTSLKLARGENFVDALRRAGVRAEDRNAAAAAFGRLYDLRRLRPGQELRLTTAAPAQTLFQMVAEGHEPQFYLLGLDFKVDAANRVVLKRLADGTYAAKPVAVRLSTRLASVSGRINGSLYNTAKRIGAPDKVVADLAAIFAYDVDFQREVFGGDEFEAVFEARYDEDGRLVEAGDVLYGRMKWKGRQKEKGYYRFASADGGARADYFDWSGESAKRLLMKTPIDGARLSSGFGARRHPISGYNRQHKGVDFAAPRGTPIKAAGDGVVERADRYGGYGNYVRIRHGQGYKTAYAHLSGFAKGMRAGKRVEQGDVIGYVGSTGASTGPHLHYEVLHEGKHVNPQKLKVATGVSLSGTDLKKFKEARDLIDAMRRASSEAERLTEDAAAKQL